MQDVLVDELMESNLESAQVAVTQPVSAMLVFKMFKTLVYTIHKFLVTVRYNVYTVSVRSI